MFKKRSILIFYQSKHMLNTYLHNYTKRHNNINLMQHKCNITFGKLNPSTVGIDICIQLSINILSFKNAIIFRKRINSLPL